VQRYLLDGNTNKSSSLGPTLEILCEMFYNIELVRSHGLTGGSKLELLFKSIGIKTQSSLLAHGASLPLLPTWKDWIGLNQAPIT